MPKKSHQQMLINVQDDETRIALITDHILEDLYIEQTHNIRNVGNIYRGEVVKVQPSFQAAFIEYGEGRHGFLALADIPPKSVGYKGSKDARPSILDLLSPGQTVLVQVLKDEIGNKGAALTANITLPGRFLVFMPNSDKGGISKRIEDPEQRSRLKALLEGLGEEVGGVIVRTAGVERSLSDLKKDFITLRRRWNQIQSAFDELEEPGLLYQEEDLVVRMLRDHYNDHINSISIDEPEAFQRSLEFFKTCIPTQQKRLNLYIGERSLFSVHGIEEQVEKLSSNRVPLPSGGSLVIDQAEALVAIDVNSGKSNQGKNIEETALHTNLEAAEETARQLRLRNLSGLIVIDFIDMGSNKNRSMVVKRLEDHLQVDKAKWTLGEISQFGLLEMSRQRSESALSRGLQSLCPTCGGLGSILSVPSLANVVLRRLREAAAQGDVSEVHTKVPLELANCLLNNKRTKLSELELEFGIRIVITAELSADYGVIPEFEVKFKHGKKSKKISNKPTSSRRKRGRGSKETRDSRDSKELRQDQEELRSDAEPVEAKEQEAAPTETEGRSSKSSRRDKPAQEKRGRSRSRSKEEPRQDSKSSKASESAKDKKKTSGAQLLFSSSHVETPKEETKKPASKAKAAPKSEVPAGTVLYSSAHREGEGEEATSKTKAKTTTKKTTASKKSSTKSKTESNDTEAVAKESSAKTKAPAKRGSSTSKAKSPKASSRTKKEETKKPAGTKTAASKAKKEKSEEAEAPAAKAKTTAAKKPRSTKAKTTKATTSKTRAKKETKEAEEATS